MPPTYTAAALAIATTDTNIPIDLDGLIASAAAGNALARSFLRPVVLRIALEELTNADAAERVTERILALLGDSARRTGPATARSCRGLDRPRDSHLRPLGARGPRQKAVGTVGRPGGAVRLTLLSHFPPETPPPWPPASPGKAGGT